MCQAIIALLLCLAQGQAEVRIGWTETVYWVNGRTFSIGFAYDLDAVTIPATFPPGAPHYKAKISVFELGKEKVLIHSFEGEYTAGLCREDRPSRLVRQALKEAGKLTSKLDAIITEVEKTEKEPRAIGTRIF